MSDRAAARHPDLINGQTVFRAWRCPPRGQHCAAKNTRRMQRIMRRKKKR
jgi:hypothetical protein